MVLAQQAPSIGHALTVCFMRVVLLGVPAMFLAIVWMRRYGGMMALPREHVPQRQRPQRLRSQMRTRNVGEPAPPPAEPPNREAPPPPQAPDPEPPGPGSLPPASRRTTPLRRPGSSASSPTA